MNCEYVREAYGVPARVGLMVTYRGESGVISKDRGNYVGITLDSEKPSQVSNVHPTDPNLVYLKTMAKPRKMTRSQKRYKEYIDSGYEDGFATWLGIRPKPLY